MAVFQFINYVIFSIHFFPLKALASGAISGWENGPHSEELIVIFYSVFLLIFKAQNAYF